MFRTRICMYSTSLFYYTWGLFCAVAIMLFNAYLAPQPIHFKLIVAVEVNLKCIYISTIYVSMIIVGGILYVNVAPVACILANRLLLFVIQVTNDPDQRVKKVPPT